MMTMMLHEELKQLPERVYELFNPQNAHEVNKENLEALGEGVKALIFRRLSEVREHDKNKSLRFSNLGKKDRQLWYEANKPELGEQMASKTYLKFMYGDMLEELLLFLVKEAGYKVENEQLEVEEDGIKGHIDSTIEGITVDVKSASPHSFRKFETGALKQDDPFGYITQISGYAQKVSPDKGGAFLAFDKVHGDICISSVGPADVKALDLSGRIKHLKEVIASDKMPPRCYDDAEDGKSGNRKLGTNCSYCAFKEACWPGLRTFFYSNGPRFLTVVNRQPDVPEKGQEARVDDKAVLPF